MQDRAKLTLEMLKDKKRFRLLEPHHWPRNSPDLNPVDFGMLGLQEQNVYRSRRITNLDCLKEAIVDEWNKTPQEIIVKLSTRCKPKLRRVIEVEDPHIERY